MHSTRWRPKNGFYNRCSTMCLFRFFFKFGYLSAENHSGEEKEKICAILKIKRECFCSVCVCVKVPCRLFFLFFFRGSESIGVSSSCSRVPHSLESFFPSLVNVRLFEVERSVEGVIYIREVSHLFRGKQCRRRALSLFFFICRLPSATSRKKRQESLAWEDVFWVFDHPPAFLLGISMIPVCLCTVRCTVSHTT